MDGEAIYCPPSMPPNESLMNLKKELQMIAASLVDGSRLSCSKAVEVESLETPALAAAPDNELPESSAEARKSGPDSAGSCHEARLFPRAAGGG